MSEAATSQPDRGPRAVAADLVLLFRAFGRRQWLAALLGVAAALLVLGVPTGLVDSPWFGRSIEADAQDYALWVATAVLGGLLFATFTLPAPEQGRSGLLPGGALSYLAVGCPVCNKVVVVALGTSGALTLFDPLQLYLGLAALALLGWSLWLRARAIIRGCPR